MALSDQIKTPGQVVGAVGGGGSGGGAPAGTGFVKVTSGVYDTPANLSAADIPDLDAAKITTGQLVDGRMPTASNAATIGAISTVANAALPKAGYASGSAMTGAIALTGTHAAPGNTITSGHRDSSGNWIFNSGGTGYAFNVGGSTLASLGNTGLYLLGSQSSAGAGTTCLYRGSSGEFIANCGGGGWFSINVNNNQQHVFGATSGYQLPTAQSGLSSTNYGLWRDAQSTCIQSGGGCMVNSAKLVSRANSTAYALCPAPTGDVIRCLLQDSSSKRAVALLDASGTITFEAGSHADYVASSSPASGEVGVYIVSPGASGSLTIKPGSAGARSIAANVARARA